MATPTLQYLLSAASSGTTPASAADSAPGTAVNLALSGFAWTSTANGKGLLFNGAGVGTSGALSGTKAQTQLSGSKTATLEVVLDLGTGSVEFDVVAGLSASAGLDACLLITAGPTPTTDIELFSGGNTSAGTYTIGTGRHVVHFVFDSAQATTANRLLLYVDGTLVTIANQNNYPAQNQGVDNGNAWSDMFFTLGDWAPSGLNYDGKVYYAAIYPVILDATTIAAHATALTSSDDADPNALHTVIVGPGEPHPINYPDIAMRLRVRKVAAESMSTVVTAPAPTVLSLSGGTVGDDISTRWTTLMALGDSLCEGYPSDVGGWRIGFFQAHPGFYSLGSLVDSAIADATKTQFEGHGGYTSSDILSNISTWYGAKPADVVLLMIGTNDAFFSGGTITPSQYGTNVVAIVNAMKAVNPAVRTYIGRVIYQDPTLGTDATIDSYRAALTSALVTAGLTNTTEIPFSKMPHAYYEVDGTHPNPTGYALMAQEWGAAFPLEATGLFTVSSQSLAGGGTSGVGGAPVLADAISLSGGRAHNVAGVMTAGAPLSLAGGAAAPTAGEPTIAAGAALSGGAGGTAGGATGATGAISPAGGGELPQAGVAGVAVGVAPAGGAAQDVGGALAAAPVAPANLALSGGVETPVGGAAGETGAGSLAGGATSDQPGATAESGAGSLTGGRAHPAAGAVSTGNAIQLAGGASTPSPGAAPTVTFLGSLSGGAASEAAGALAESVLAALAGGTAAAAGGAETIAQNVVQLVLSGGTDSPVGGSGQDAGNAALAGGASQEAAGAAALAVAATLSGGRVAPHGGAAGLGAPVIVTLSGGRADADGGADQATGALQLIADGARARGGASTVQAFQALTGGAGKAEPGRTASGTAFNVVLLSGGTIGTTGGRSTVAIVMANVWAGLRRRARVIVQGGKQNREK